MEGFPESDPLQAPIPEDKIPQRLGNDALGPQVSEPNLERFVDLPNRREALRGKDAENLTVYLSHAIAKKLYRCPCCNGDISIGSEHVIMSRVQMSKKFTHHHLDFSCMQEQILPNLTAIETIKPQDASATSVNAKARKYRNRRRRAN